ncbi:hypothetical protein JD844_019513 [Phrynosoma platyrhinos]|uniref:LITAF domain-containing protein n=1 Tax=Phrynosoma platyrhinos TaxID=52577 RepID=A0ABQ7TQU9_PHRPL|nr:hypothetical protein JD844_019513 [Phrynosoma platyrhinos]
MASKDHPRDFRSRHTSPNAIHGPLLAHGIISDGLQSSPLKTLEASMHPKIEEYWPKTLTGKMEQQSKKEVSIPMATLDPRPEPYAPSYPSSYPLQSYPPQSYGPEKYTPDSYLPQPCSGDPYTPTDGCCGECPSPPPYSCEDVPCDRVGPEVVYRVGSLTYAVCTGMCMMGCCLGCCLLPFMTNCCKDVDHYCPHCRYHIYRYKRL